MVTPWMWSEARPHTSEAPSMVAHVLVANGAWDSFLCEQLDPTNWKGSAEPKLDNPKHWHINATLSHWALCVIANNPTIWEHFRSHEPHPDPTTHVEHVVMMLATTLRFMNGTAQRQVEPLNILNRAYEAKRGIPEPCGRVTVILSA